MYWVVWSEVIWVFGYPQRSWEVDMPRKKKETVDSLKYPENIHGVDSYTVAEGKKLKNLMEGK